MSHNMSGFSEPGLDIYFQSARARVDWQGNFTSGTVHSMGRQYVYCAIYDLKDYDVVSALKSVADKVTLRIAYDGGKQKEVTGGPKLRSKTKRDCTNN